MKTCAGYSAYIDMAGVVWKLAGFAIAVSVTALAVKSYRPELGQQIAVAAGLMFLLFAIGQLDQAYGMVRQWLSRYGLPQEFFSVIIKVTGVVYLIQFAADICRDCGETAMAGKVELAGRAIILVLCLPVIGSILELISSILPAGAL